MMKDEFQQLLRGAVGPLLSAMIRRGLNRERLRRAQALYYALVTQMRTDGYRVESHQLPFIVDERPAGSTRLQRVFGVVGLPTVWVWLSWRPRTGIRPPPVCSMDWCSSPRSLPGIARGSISPARTRCFLS
jgi:hypothetical protein